MIIPIITYVCAHQFSQKIFIESFLTTLRDSVFKNVEVLIYIFDIESEEVHRDIHYYQCCVEALIQNSPDAKIFCLIHKMDLVPDDQCDMVGGVI